MSDQSNSTASATGSVQVVVTEERNFLAGTLDLKALGRQLKGLSKKALDKIEALLENPDPKMQLAAAQFLINMQIQVTKDMNTDQLQRLIAQVKLGSGRRELIPVNPEDEEDKPPQLDFSTIRAVKS